MAKRKGGLGRGLDALFADAAPIIPEELEQEAHQAAAEAGKLERSSASGKGSKAAAGVSAETPAEDDPDRVIYVDIDDIKPNASQPRKNFNKEKLEDLAESIKENGVIQPVVVRKKGSSYELVAGERRWRASRLAGMKQIPCLIRNFDEKQNMIVAIIENMQREDLDPIEEAAGLREMVDRFGFTQAQVSKSLGKSRAYIANSMRLLKLPPEVQDMISQGQLSAAHGRTIINIEDKEKQKAVANKIVKDGLSVRATERLAEKIKDDARPERKRTKSPKSADLAAAESELRTITGTKVRINGSENSGKIEMEYYSLEELNRLIDLLRSVK
ncbi:ParB/RepB/Spo0J family partition protein [Mobilibacterium timonense]|uniref:ParB/RepB/Spo0J family partition protein n=1 Tax=Mobilibacterium timonense TaxID=1871012 RepID=UPI0009877E56|nr:ParB/RepB/Spo0J family partition protein [Mobilibacterium timonense]